MAYGSPANNHGLRKDRAVIVATEYRRHTGTVLAQAGWQLWYVPQAVVTHFGEASSRQVREEMYIQLYRSKLQFFRKVGGQRYARQAKALLALAYLPRFAAAGLVSLVRPIWRPRSHLFHRLLAELPQM